jgi:steroid delta-isomerase-like uncharacterized protein
MSTDTNKALVRRWWEALNKGNALAIIEEIYASDYVLHDPSQPAPVQGLEGVRGFVSAVLTGFPDTNCTIEELVAEDDKVTQRITARGTHKGEFQGIPPTDKPISISLMVISRIANNKIAEEWQLVDSLSMLQQLGVMPSQG